MATNLLISKNYNPKLNLAIEEYLTFSYQTKDPILFFWQNQNTIVVGRNQNAYAEVAMTDAWNDQVTVIRRNTGGGAVYQDLGNINFSLIVNNDSIDLDYQKALAPIISFLNENGINAKFSGRNDLVVDEFKISGNAQLKTKERTLVHGTLLYDVDLTKIAKYLTVNEEKIKHQKVKSKAARVKNIRNFYQEQNQDLDVQAFFKKLIAYYLSLDEVKMINLTEGEQAEIHKLFMNKYDRWEWTFEKNSEFEVVKQAYLEGKGFIQINSTVDQGTIQKIKIFGDFLGTAGTEKLEELLTGKKLEQSELNEVLNQVDLKKIFGENFTNDDILNILFR